MKRHMLSLAMLFLFVALPPTVQATVITGLYNTGVDSVTRVPLADGTSPDPNYRMGAFPPAALTPARVKTSASGFPVGPWLGDNSLSTWIGPEGGPSLDGPGGSYRYDTTFTVVGNPADASAIVGQWAADDADPTNDFIQLNGVTVAVGNGGFGGWTAFTIPAGSPSYISGTNTLSFFVQNGGGPTGVRVEMVPEPSSICLLMAGAAAVMGLYRRRTR